MNDLTLAILCVSAAIGGYGVCLMALWAWRGIVTAWQTALNSMADDIP